MKTMHRCCFEVARGGAREAQPEDQSRFVACLIGLGAPMADCDFSLPASAEAVSCSGLFHNWLPTIMPAARIISKP